MKIPEDRVALVHSLLTAISGRSMDAIVTNMAQEALSCFEARGEGSSSLYEELRAAIDDGSESMTHKDALEWIQEAHKAQEIEVKPHLDQLRSRRGNFCVDGGGNWYFENDDKGYWMEIDIREHMSCVYVCMSFEDPGPYQSPYGEKVMKALLETDFEA